MYSLRARLPPQILEVLGREYKGPLKLITCLEHLLLTFHLYQVPELPESCNCPRGQQSDADRTLGSKPLSELAQPSRGEEVRSGALRGQRQTVESASQAINLSRPAAGMG